MANTIKIGLPYFSHDTDMYEDPKVKFIKAKYKLLGYGFYNRLLEIVYKEKGYYAEFSNKQIVLFSDETGLTTDQCKEMLNDCLEEDLFDKSLYDKYQIITSKRIQRNYLKGCEKRKSIQLNENYLLINPAEVIGEKFKGRLDVLPDNSGINSNNSGINPINDRINSQRIEENRIEKNSINSPDGRKSETKPDFILDLLEIFSEEYEKNRGFQFELISKGKERKAIGKLLSTYKEKNKSSPKTSEQTKEDFRNYFKACLSIPDTWLRENMSPSLIVNKFNEIKTILKKKQNGNTSNSKNGATVEGILNAIAKNIGKSPTTVN